MDKANSEKVGWIIIFLGKWSKNKDAVNGKQKLYHFFKKYDILKTAQNVYVKQIAESEFEEWKYRIKFVLHKDGYANAVFIPNEQWESMMITPSVEKFK